MLRIDEHRVEEINRLPEGHVLRRPAQKVKERIIRPRTINMCDVCWVKKIDTKMVKTERGGGQMSLVECLECYVGREHDTEW